MTILDRFTEFARALSDKRREEIEGVLAAIMASDEAADFTDAELAELDCRLAENPPEYATDEEIAAVFRRTTRG